MRSQMVLVVFWTHMTGSIAQTSCPGPQTASELAEALWGPGSGYDKDTRPTVAMAARAGELTHDLPADIIMLNQQVNTLVEVDQREMSFTVELWSRAIWFDPRLRYNSTCEKPPGTRSGYETYGYHQSFDFSSHFHKLWKPSLIVSNLREPEKVFEEQFWVEGSGRVWWTRKVRWTLGCEMDFRYLPFDRQECMIEMREFRYPTSEVLLTWTPEWQHLANEPNASIGVSRLDVAQPVRTPSCTTGGAVGWRLDYQNSYGAAPVGPDTVSLGSAQDALIFVFDFTRDATYYKEFVIRPATLIGIVSYATFFVSRGAVPARVAMCIISILTLNGISVYVVSSLPPISGKVWLLEYVTLVYFLAVVAMIEYTVAHYLTRVEARLKPLLAEAKQAHAVRAAEAKEKTDPAASATTDSGAASCVVPASIEVAVEAVAPETAPAVAPGAAAQSTALQPTPSGRRRRTAKTPPPESPPSPPSSPPRSPPVHTSRFAACGRNSTGLLHTMAVKEMAAQRAMKEKVVHALEEGAMHRRRNEASLKVVSQATRFDRLLVTFDGMSMRLKDDQLDVFFRYTFPVAYAIAVVIINLKLPNQDLTQDWPKCQWTAPVTT